MGYNREYGQRERNAHEDRTKLARAMSEYRNGEAGKDARIRELEHALREAWPYVPDHHGPVQHRIRKALGETK